MTYVVFPSSRNKKSAQDLTTVKVRFNLVQVFF